MRNVDDAKRVRVTRGPFKGAEGDVEEIKKFGRVVYFYIYLDPHPISGLRCRTVESKSTVKIIG